MTTILAHFSPNRHQNIELTDFCPGTSVAGIDDIEFPGAGSKDERQQFSRAEGFLSRSEEPLPRAVVGIDVVNAHDFSCKGSGVDEYAKGKSEQAINANRTGL